MKFKFKIQKYQTDAVEATAYVFCGQPPRQMRYEVKTVRLLDASDRECDPFSIPPGLIATTIAIHLGRRIG